MLTECYQVFSQSPHQRSVLRAVEILKNDGVIVYPTDTIYGLGASLHSREGVQRIYQIKKIATNKLLSFLCMDLKQVAQYAKMSNTAHKILRRCLPGPFTFILPATRLVPKVMFQKRRTVGIRIPDSPLCMELIEQLGSPIISTSIPDGQDSILNSPYEIDGKLNSQIDLILDAGELHSEPSTVVDLTNDEIQILREGAGDPALVG